MTCHLKENGALGDFGLLGVAAGARTAGLGTLLTQTGMAWFIEQGARNVCLSTQGRNIAAQRLFQRLGFLTQDIHLWYHRWFTCMSYTIPFNKAYITGQETVYMQQALANSHISGDGPFTRRCHAWLESRTGARRALLTTSCTHALEMAALLLDIQPGDEVIVPSFTFVSTVNAFVLRGARPVFVDIRPDTLNLDETRLEALITPRTRAILPVHYAGVGCEMDAILEIANRHGIPVVEDNAHGLLGRYKGRNLGTLGCMATQCFPRNQEFLLRRRRRPADQRPALHRPRRDHPRERHQPQPFLPRPGGQTTPGWISAPATCRLIFWRPFCSPSSKPMQKSRAAGAASGKPTSRPSLPLRREWDIRLPVIPDGCEQPYHMFYLLLPSLAVRTALIEHLKSRGILSVFHYLPLHLSEMGLRFGGQPGDCPVTEQVSDRLLRLPFYAGLAEPEQALVIREIQVFLRQACAPNNLPALQATPCKFPSS